MSVFQDVTPYIEGNPLLLRPQKEAYSAAYSFYREFSTTAQRESLIVMPTGSGKTGVISLLPFNIAKGRVLVIAPGKIVRKTVYESLDSIKSPENTFWYQHKVLLDKQKAPNTYLYKGFNPQKPEEKNMVINQLEHADIVITNIHRISGSSEEINLTKLLEEDFFDMIIIDEAHHSAANMWQEALGHFNASKVIKLTATPFRKDRREITTNLYDPIYEYTIGEAIQDKLIKEVVKEEELPNKLEFVDTETNETYSLEMAKYKLGDEWVSRSVAMSKECSMQVIEHTKKTLEDKRQSSINHQVLAITCNDDHARDVAQWFNDVGLRATYVSSHLDDTEIERRLSSYQNGEYDVMISIQMLGEGYNNPNISIISIFRPFKSLSPYTQAIGRGLRRIRDENAGEIDNFCNVVYHRELNLRELWDYYKSQISYGEQIRRQVRKQIELSGEQLTLFDFEDSGFVEKKPGPWTPKDDEGKQKYEMSIGEVTGYSSQGIGASDSLSPEGVERYRAARNKIAAEVQSNLEEERNRIITLLEQGAITSSDADALISKAENTLQQKISDNYSEFAEQIRGDQMRRDFVHWVNQKVEQFFNESALEKEGFELYESLSYSEENKINNFGFINKNLYQTLYSKTKKSIGIYTPKDFAYAKETLIEKIDYYLDIFGTKKEE